MALATRKTTDRIPSVLPREQALALFEAEVRRVAGLTAEQFLAKWDGGRTKTSTILLTGVRSLTLRS